MIRLALFRAGVWLAKRLPPRLLYDLAIVIGAALSLLPTPPRRRLASNLARALYCSPDAPLVRRSVARAYRLHAQNYVDLLREPVSAAAETVALIAEGGEGWPAFHRAVQERRGAVLVSAHFGRFELLTHFIGHLGFPVTLPVERLHPPALFALMCRLRGRPTFQLVPHDGALRPCLRALDRGEVAALFADWDPTGQGVEVEFFGAPARLPAGPAYMALRAGVPIFIGILHAAAAPGRFVSEVDAPIVVERTGNADADVQRATQQVARAFERHIRRHPDHWVMFHDLWATPGDTPARPNSGPNLVAAEQRISEEHTPAERIPERPTTVAPRP